MSFIAGAVVGNLVLDTTGFTGGITAAIAAAAQGGPSIAAPLLAGANAIAASFERCFEQIKTAIAGAGKEFHNIGEEAERVGVSTGFLSAIGRQAADTGSSLEGVGSALKFLNKNMAEAVEGDKTAVEAFANLGLSQADVQDSLGNTEAMFRKVTDAIAAMPTTAEKTRVSMELLGRGGSELIPLFNKGTAGIDAFRTKMDGLGATVTEQMAASGEAFKTLGSTWDAAWAGIRNVVATPFLNVVHNDSKLIEGTIIRISDLLKREIPPALQFISGIVDFILAGVDKALYVLDGLTFLTDVLGISDHAGRDVADAHKIIGDTRKVVNDFKIEVSGSFDAKEASSQIADKLRPELEQASQRQRQDMEGAARRALVAANTGGRA